MGKNQTHKANQRARHTGDGEGGAEQPSGADPMTQLYS